jgi:hypothetical protein
MSSWRAFLEATHLTALGVWAGAVALAAANAGLAFPTMKAMGVRLPSVPEALAADDWRFVAGALAAKGFVAGDIAAFLCCLIAVLCFVGLLLMRRLEQRAATIVRAAALSVALACLASMLFIITPQINAASAAHYAAALRADAAEAARHRAAVDELHRPAQWLMLAEILGVLTAAWSGAYACARPLSEIRPSARRVSPYPEPDLLRKRPT